jgi:hypothetical protein
MNSMRRRVSGVSANLPKTINRMPKATGMSEVGNLWPVRTKLAPPRRIRRIPKRTVIFAITNGCLRGHDYGRISLSGSLREAQIS